MGFGVTRESVLRGLCIAEGIVSGCNNVGDPQPTLTLAPIGFTIHRYSALPQCCAPAPSSTPHTHTAKIKTNGAVSSQ